MITISLDQISKHQPCRRGWERLLTAKGPSQSHSAPFPMSDLLDTNGFDDTLWALQCLPEHDLLWRKFAWWCASQVACHATDPRVQQCLDTVYNYCLGKATIEELRFARSAAWSAVETVAWSAAWSAAASAVEAATEAAKVARSAAAVWSAGSAVAAESAARSAQVQKLREILDTGVCDA